MKKIASILIVAMLLCSVLTACSFEKTPAQVEEALKADGWMVTKTEDSDSTLLVCTKISGLNSATGTAYYSKNETDRENKKALGTNAKTSGNWVYYGTSGFITAFEAAAGIKK